MTESAKYDRIGVGYTQHRRADRRLVEAIVGHLGLNKGDTLADIGAGSGNYSRALADHKLRVTAIEPSRVMRQQAKPHQGVTWVDGTAENIPLDTDSVSSVVATLSAHHFSSLENAAKEMMRVSTQSIVIFTYDPRFAEPYWLADYFPEIFAQDYTLFPPLAEVAQHFENAGMEIETAPFVVPHDLEDFFLAAGWRRPEIYLDPGVRSCMSVFAMSDQDRIAEQAECLRQDLASREWHERYGDLLNRQTFDGGYRFLILRHVAG